MKKKKSPGQPIRSHTAKHRETLQQRILKDALVEDENIARAWIMTGRVLVNNTPVKTCGAIVGKDADIRIKPGKDRANRVSRGALKLEHAVKVFQVSDKIKDSICMDIGASTGGFTEILLEHAAKSVYAVDVAYGELAWKLRKDPRVVLRERINAKTLTVEIIPDLIDIIVTDVSFISLKKALPAGLTLLKPGGMLIALIKPQFEASLSDVGKKGIITDLAVHASCCQDICQWLASSGLQPIMMDRSPIKGTKGNTEFLVMARKERA